MFKRTVILLSSGFAAAAIAQSPAPSAAPATARPGHTCVKPEVPGRLATGSSIKLFNSESKKYRECLRDFVKVQGELVKLHTEQGNAAVKEFNDYVTAMNKLKAEEGR